MSAVLMRHSNRRTGWLSRNRWGLGLLPLAAVLALGASSDRVKTYYWDADLHQPTVARKGVWLDYAEPYTDSTGDNVRKVSLKLDSVRRLSAQEATGSLSYEMPEGTAAVEVTFSVESDPQTPLFGCQAALRDTAGNRYFYLVTNVAGGQDIPVCTPRDAPGPYDLLGKRAEPMDGESPRPASYTVTRVWVVPADAEYTELDLWWDTPRYVAFRAGS
ncbi:hypothetical protein KIH74_18115 [Kineosporia sp. J2-2]|uniref:Uncharacterized protein n=1 Tax=Kineosporia corallincola TaxID=2835133 RepID=A0ABS5TKH8_9ACTN|nr:hypothetical protein [Kineosporia corallincola]MBT0770864.1 hypothetical protein [Kineosporia corallincola]